MKKLKSFMVLCAVITTTMMTSSCQKENGNNRPPVNPTLTSACVQNPAACNPVVYNQGNGYQPYNPQNSAYNNGYPYNYQGGFYYTKNSAYLCNCPVGTIPTYNTYGGLGCVNSNQASGNGYAYFGWNGTPTNSGATNNQWVNIPQVSNYTGYNRANNCYNGVVQSCLVDQPGTCSAAYTCRSTSAQSRLGLCVSNTTVNNGGTQYSGGSR